MKEFKGTKGEWEYAESLVNPKKHKFSIIGDFGTRLIADIYRTPSQGEEIAHANAKLIAAAPELLKAIQYLLNVNDDGRWDRAASESFARDAIKKALGNENQ